MQKSLILKHKLYAPSIRIWFLQKNNYNGL
jgi:hypothetical protein